MSVIVKRAAALLFAGCMAFSSALTVFADSKQSDENRDRENYHRKGKWGYTVLEDGTAAVSDYFGKAKELNVPEEIDGYTVTAIGGGWYNGADGKPVLYGNVHGISYAADGSVEESSVYSPFTGNTFIEDVTLPETVTCIGAISFKGCISLRSVKINDGVEVIGSNCFEGCTELEELNLPDSLKYVDQQAFYECPAIKSLELPDCRYETAAFERCTGLESVTLPEGIASTSPYMFSECSSLKNVFIPEGVEEIGDSSFTKCTSLEYVQLPDSVKAIYNNAFSGCTALTQAYFGEDLETIGSRAFADCTSLKELYVGENVNKLGDSAFGMTADGEHIEGFTLVCPDFSPVKAYAEGNGIPFSLTAPSPEVQASAPDTQLPRGLDSEMMFIIVIAIIVLAALAVFIILVLVLKNNRSGDDQ